MSIKAPIIAMSAVQSIVIKIRKKKQMPVRSDLGSVSVCVKGCQTFQIMTLSVLNAY